MLSRCILQSSRSAMQVCLKESWSYLSIICSALRGVLFHSLVEYTFYRVRVVSHAASLRLYSKFSILFCKVLLFARLITTTQKLSPLPSGPTTIRKFWVSVRLQSFSSLSFVSSWLLRCLHVPYPIITYYLLLLLLFATRSVQSSVNKICSAHHVGTQKQSHTHKHILDSFCATELGYSQ